VKKRATQRHTCHNRAFIVLPPRHCKWIGLRRIVAHIAGAGKPCPSRRILDPVVRLAPAALGPKHQADLTADGVTQADGKDVAAESYICRAESRKGVPVDPVPVVQA